VITFRETEIFGFNGVLDCVLEKKMIKYAYSTEKYFKKKNFAIVAQSTPGRPA